MQRRHWIASWACPGLTLAAATSVAWTATASALSGTAVNVGSPLAITGLSVGVDPSGTSYVAWANSKELPPVTTDVVQYCVLPPGSSSCAHTGTLTPANGAAEIDSVQVVVDGTVVVILADVRDAKSNDYVPEQEWQSTDGGSSFTAVDGGRSVADGIINSSSTFPLNAVVVPGTDALGYGWQTAGLEPPTFDEFLLTSPPECSVMTCAPDEAFATLAPASEPDQIGDAGGEFASELGTDPGVLGVFNINFAGGSLACPVAPSDTNFGAAFVYGSGPQSPTNSYDIPPGQSDSAWKVPVMEAFCDSYPLAVVGGPSGFGVLEIADPHRGGYTTYQRFDQATMKFDTPVVTMADANVDQASASQDQASLSQDGAGGVYATYLGTDAPQPAISLSYSDDGGTTWSGPNALNANTDSGASHLTSSVNAAGQGWATWFDAETGSVFAQQFDAADSVPPPTATTISTTQTSGTARGSSLTIPAGTIGEADRATISGAYASGATGTVTYALYSRSSCSGSSAVFKSAASNVSGGVAAPSGGVSVALSPGRYYWQAAYSGNAGSARGVRGNLPSSSACGSEVLTVVPPVAIAKHASIRGTTITIRVTCVSIPCTLRATLKEGGSKRITADSVAILNNGKRSKTVTLASGTFTVRKTGSRKLAIHLTGTGKHYFRHHHGPVNATVEISEQTPGGIVRTPQALRIARA